MNIMHSVTMRQIKLNKRRTIVTIMGVIISVAMITAVTTFAATMMDYLGQNVMMSSGEWYGCYKEVPAEKIRGISQAQCVDESFLIESLGFSRLEGGKNEDKPYLYFAALDNTAMERMRIEPKLIEGRLPANGNEIVIPDHIRTNAGIDYKIGDVIEADIGERIINTGLETIVTKSQSYSYRLFDYSGADADVNVQEELSPKQHRSFTIVGIMMRPGWENYRSPGYTSITVYEGNAEYADIYTLKDNPMPSLYNDMVALAKSEGVQVEVNDDLLMYKGILPLSTVSITLYSVVLIVVLIIMAGAVSMIRNAFYISMGERRKYMGVMSGVGATAKQKRMGVYAEAAVIGAIGIPLGILVGIGGIALTFALLNPTIADLSTYGIGFKTTVSLISVAAAVVFSMVTIYISALVPAIKGGRISPMAAIRQSNDVRIRRRNVRTFGITRKLFGFEAELSLKNIKRNPKSYRTTVSALAVSVILFLTVVYFMGQFMDVGALKGIGAETSDILIGYSVNEDESTAYEDMRIADKISSLSGISGAEIVIHSNSLISGTVDKALFTDRFSEMRKQYESNEDVDINGMGILAVDDNTLSRLANDSGTSLEQLKSERGCIVLNDMNTMGYSEEGDMHVDYMQVFRQQAVGSSISVESPGGTENLKICGLSSAKPQFVGPQMVGLSYNVAISVDTLKELLGGKIEPDSYCRIYIRLESEKNYEAALSSINELRKQFSAGADAMIYDNIAQAREARQLSMVVSVFGIGFVTLISLVGVTNIINTVSTGIDLRTREFAMLKSVGITPKGFNKMIRFESLFYGLKALMWGLPVSVILMLLLNRVMGTTFSFAFKLPWLEMALVSAGIFVVTGITMLYATGKVKKQNIMDGLRSDNI